MTPSAETLKTTGALELRLFGTGEVWLEGERLAVGHRKTLALLAFLALEGETPRSQLAGVFWSEYDEESARRNLRRELHRLRESGLRDQVATTGENLRLLGLQTTDVAQFLFLIEAGHLEAALEVYTSEFLKGLRLEKTPEFDGWLDEKRTVLATVHRRAQLELAERLETRGNWLGALELHRQVLKEDVLQERQHREVMRFEYLLGNREAALAQFEECKRLLSEELGLEPLPATVQLAQQIRAAQKLEPSVAVQLVSSKALIAPLIGRETVLSELSSSVAPLTVVLGDAGVGKTFLLDQFAPRGLRISFRQVSSQTPLYVIAEALRELLGNLEARDRFDQLEAVWQQEAARLVPELAPNSNRQPQERLLFLEGLARTLECLNLENTAIVLEDLHWADSASLELIVHLVRRAVREPKQMRLLATARLPEMGVEASDILAALEKDGLTKTITLESLTELEVHELVCAMSGAEMQSFSSRLFAVTAGNPFFLLETVRYLFEQGTLELQGETWVSKTDLEDMTLPLPPSVREAVLKRVDGLGSAARRLLETAALTDNGFLLEEIQPATALNEWEGLEGLERAVTAQLLRRLEVGFGFVHDLARQALQGALGLERQRLIHSKLAVSLEQAVADPARIAGHLEQAGKAVAAVPWRIKAAENATRVYAYSEALEQHQKALYNGADEETAFFCHVEKLKILQLLDQPEPIAIEIKAIQDIAVHSGKTQLLHEAKLILVNYEHNLGHFGRVLELTNELFMQPDLSLEDRIKALFRQGMALLRQGNLQDADTRLQQALEQSPENLLSAKILLTRCQIAVRLGNPVKAQGYAQQSLNIFIKLNDPIGQTEALQALGNVVTAQGEVRQSIVHHLHGLEIAERTQNLNFQRPLLMNLVLSHLRLKELQTAGLYLEKIKKLPTQSLDPHSKIHFHYCVGLHAQLSGQLGTALKHFSIQVELTDQTENPAAKIRSRLSVANIFRYCGAFQKALEILGKAWTISQEHQLVEYSLEILLERIRCQMRLPNKQADFNILEQYLTGNQDSEDHLFAQMVKAEFDLQHKNPKAAKQHLENKQPFPQMEIAFLSLQLQIMVQSKKPDAKLLNQAQQLPTLTSYEALEFQKIYAAALETNKQLQEAQHLRNNTKQLMLEMAESVKLHPDLQAAFLELHADLTKLV